MKHFVILAVAACLCVAASSRPARAVFVTYDIYQNGTSGTLLAEFTTTGFVDFSTDLNPFTLTKAVSGLGTGPGILAGTTFSSANPIPDITFVVIPSATRNPPELDAVPTSHQFPTSPGTYTLDTSLSSVLNGLGTQINTPDTMVVTATPEPASFTMLSVGALGLIGYGWRRRKRTAT